MIFLRDRISLKGLKKAWLCETFHFNLLSDFGQNTILRSSSWLTKPSTDISCLLISLSVQESIKILLAYCIDYSNLTFGWSLLSYVLMLNKSDHPHAISREMRTCIQKMACQLSPQLTNGWSLPSPIQFMQHLKARKTDKHDGWPSDWQNPALKSYSVRKGLDRM